MVEDEDETWSQTVLTVTPEEDAVVRELSPETLVSATPDTPLAIDSIIFRRPFSSSGEFVQPAEQSMSQNDVAAKEARDAENQTYLQGVPAVQIPVTVKDEASQTVYMSSPCPPLKYYQDIMTSMNDVPMPTPVRSTKTATIATFSVDTPHDDVVDELMAMMEEESFREVDLSEEDETDAIARDVLEFVLTRAFWILNPASQKKGKGVDEEAQTHLKYNNRLKAFVMDVDTLTDLICHPNLSNSNLLANYRSTRTFVQSLVHENLEMSIEAMNAVNEITNEIIDRCAERVKFPMVDTQVQTVATYKLPCENEEDVVRKLKMGVIVDPSEAMLVVEPLIDDMLADVCCIVSKNARPAVRRVMCSILQKTYRIVTKLVELRMETQPKSLDEVLDERRKKILELISKKSTESMSTQTFLAAVHEVTKIREPKEILCAICKTKSPCQWCQVNSDDEIPPQEIKMNRTQDILFAYKPCYVIATPSERRRYAYIEHSCASQEKLKPTRRAVQSTQGVAKDESSATVNVVFKHVRKTTSGESSTGWSRVIDTTMNPWSMSGSASSIGTMLQQSSGMKCGQPPLETQQALQILKNTFCSRGTCTGQTCMTGEVDCRCRESKKSLCNEPNCRRRLKEAAEIRANTFERKAKVTVPQAREVPTASQSNKKIFCYCNHCEAKKQLNQCANCTGCSMCAFSDSDS